MQNMGVMHGEIDSADGIVETDSELIIPATLTREGVLSYPRGRYYRPASELKDALKSFEKAWVTTERHPEPFLCIVTNRKKQVKGEISDVVFDADSVDVKGRKSPSVKGKIHLYKSSVSRQLLDKLRNLELRDVSIGFTYDAIAESGVWHDEPYIYKQTNLLVNHVAVGVPKGRVQYPMIGLGVDSQKNDASQVISFSVDVEEEQTVKEDSIEAVEKQIVELIAKRSQLLEKQTTSKEEKQETKDVKEVKDVKDVKDVKTVKPEDAVENSEQTKGKVVVTLPQPSTSVGENISKLKAQGQIPKYVAY